MVKTDTIPIKLLIDTGSCTSLIRRGLFHSSFQTDLVRPIILNTICSSTVTRTKITIPLFKEFNLPNSRIEMLETDIFSDFDGLIGCNILRPLGVKIDLKENLLMTEDAVIPLIFDHSSNEYSEKDILYFDSIVLDINFIEPDIGYLTERLKTDDLNDEEIRGLTKLLRDFKSVFYIEGENLSSVGKYKHRIPTINDIPVYSRTYRFPEVHKAEVEKQVSEMLGSGIITKSSSPYNAPIWVVPKKIDNSGNQKWRVVVDYRKLNDLTIEDKFPIPNMEDLFAKLGNSQYFSTLDLAKGFHQIPILATDRHKTAFSTPTGHYEFTRMPFGLKNAPASFQRMMNEVLHDYINNICVVYLDDILIFSTSLQEHIISLTKIFRRLSEYNLKVQIDKCNFFKRESEYLGHIITPDGVRPNPSKIKVIQEISLPKTVKEIRSFLGLTGFYRKFIKDYSRIALPMISKLKKGAVINVNDQVYIDSFNKLKKILCIDPVLAYPKFDRLFVLTTDASNAALGAVLSQNGHPIAYTSRTLNKHELNYSAIEKELLAIVWAVKYFRPYLFGRKFKVQTDHRPLVWLNSLKEPNIKLQRWKIMLNEYDFDVEYIKGKTNQVADFLSRIDINVLQEEEGTIKSDIATIHSGKENLNDHIEFSESPINVHRNQIIIKLGNTYKYEKEILYEKKFRHTITLIEYFEEKVLEFFKEIFPIKGTVAIFCDNFEIFKNLQRTLVHYFSNSSELKFIRCSKFIKDIFDREDLLEFIEKFHNEKNHRGIDETYLELRDLIYFPNLKVEIHKFINNCVICNMCKFDRKPIKTKMCVTETPVKSNEIIHIDVWFLSKNMTFLTCIDKLTKHVSIHYLSDKNSLTIVEKLRERFAILGKPEKIIADNEFNTAVVRDFLKSENVDFHYTSPNTHTGNADVERFHLTLNEHIRLFKLDRKDRDLDDKALVFKSVEIYNETIHATTGYKPNELLHNKVDKSIWQKLHDHIHEGKIERVEKINQGRKDCHEYKDREFVKNLGFNNLKQKPKYIIKEVKEKNKTHFLDEKDCKRDRQIVKRTFKYQNEIPSVKFERKLTGRNYSKVKKK